MLTIVIVALVLFDLIVESYEHYLHHHKDRFHQKLFNKVRYSSSPEQRKDKPREVLHFVCVHVCCTARCRQAAVAAGGNNMPAAGSESLGAIYTFVRLQSRLPVPYHFRRQLLPGPSCHLFGVLGCSSHAPTLIVFSFTVKKTSRSFS